MAQEVACSTYCPICSIQTLAEHVFPFQASQVGSVQCIAALLTISAATELVSLILNGCASGSASHMLVSALKETLMTQSGFDSELV